jgi:glutathione synthase
MIRCTNSFTLLHPRTPSTMSVFTSWPPEVTTEQLDQLTLLATTYALSHSILYLPPVSPEKPPPPAPESAILAPISLIPTPIPRHVFAKAQNLQRGYNTLYSRIALDTSFLDDVMGPGGVADVDDFTSALWSAWKKLRDEGVPPVRGTGCLIPSCADKIDLPASPPRPLSL